MIELFVLFVKKIYIFKKINKTIKFRIYFFQESIFHAGKVGINTDRPDESLVIHGNLKITGHIIQPSDLRAKKNIVECNTADQLRNVQRLRVVR